MPDQNFYEILGVAATATPDEIRTAYRRLAKQYHPDTATGDVNRFKQISEAYDVLGDSIKRREYDYKLANDIAEAAASRPPSVRLSTNCVDFGTVRADEIPPNQRVLIDNDGGDAPIEIFPDIGSFWVATGGVSDKAWAQLIIMFRIDKTHALGEFQDTIRVLLDNGTDISAQNLQIRVKIVAAVTPPAPPVPPPYRATPRPTPPKAAPTSTKAGATAPPPPPPANTGRKLLVGSLVLLLLIIWFSSRGSGSPSQAAVDTPTGTSIANGVNSDPVNAVPTQPAQVGPTTQQLIAAGEAKINKAVKTLRLVCLSPYLCNPHPSTSQGSLVPVFVSGLDANLGTALHDYGYTSQWVASYAVAKYVPNSGPFNQKSNAFTTFALSTTVRGTGTSEGTGLISDASNAWNSSRGMPEPKSPGHATIHWILRDRTNRIVAELSYVFTATHPTAIYCNPGTGANMATRYCKINDAISKPINWGSNYHPPQGFAAIPYPGNG